MVSTVKPRLDASPIGFVCMGMVTILFSMLASGWVPREFFAIPMLLSGGIGLLVTAILEFFAKQTYFMTIFGSFGFFWLAVGTQFIPQEQYSSQHTLSHILPVVFSTWGTFSLILTVASYPVSVSMTVLMGSITLWFLALALQQLSNGFAIPVGITGLAAGLLFLYRGYAGILAQVYERPILPFLGHSLSAERNSNAHEIRKPKPKAYLP